MATAVRRKLRFSAETAMAEIGAKLSSSNDRYQAESAFGAALRADPNHADGWALMSDLMVMQGRAAEAIACAKNAVRINPHPPGWYYWSLGQAQYAAGHYSDAAETLPERNVQNSVAADSGGESGHARAGRRSPSRGGSVFGWESALHRPELDRNAAISARDNERAFHRRLSAGRTSITSQRLLCMSGWIEKGERLCRRNGWTATRKPNSVSKSCRRKVLRPRGRRYPHIRILAGVSTPDDGFGPTRDET
jgi:tetratricopeptide (TPR) repeat protein